MKTRLTVSFGSRLSTLLVLIALVCGTTLGYIHTVHAASTSASKPTIAVSSPPNGGVVHGRTVTMSVIVKNFTLVPPVFMNPPVLPPGQGHIHYVLDSAKNFDITRDVSNSTVHTWTNVTPGKHTLMAYLVTSQHVQYPGTRTASVTITVAPPPGVTSPVISGGADPAGFPSGVYGLGFLAGILVLAFGLTLRVNGYRRMAVVPSSEQRTIAISATTASKPSRSYTVALAAGLFIFLAALVMRQSKK